MQTTTPNIDKVEKLLTAIGQNPSVSYQSRHDSTGFFTVTYWPSGDKTRCAIGQGDTLAVALEQARRDAVQLLASISVADLEKAAA